MDKSVWLKSLKAGDEVRIDNKWNQGFEIHKVESLTATQIKLSNGSKARREDGYVIGSRDNRGLYVKYIKPVTAEERKIIDRRKNVQEFERFSPSHFTDEGLIEVIQFMRGKSIK